MCHTLKNASVKKGPTMDTDETELLHVAPLEADTVPDNNQAHYCHSCETPYGGLYCAACGQKNDDYRRSIFSLGWEAIASLTALEGRMFRTWATLMFKPGKVAREYADGARMKWSSPVRAYLAMSLLLFGYLAVFQINIFSLDVDVRPVEGVSGAVETLPLHQLTTKITPHFFETKREFDKRMAGRNFDLIERKIRETGMAANIELNMGDADDNQDATVSEEINNQVEAIQNSIEENKDADGETESMMMLNGERIDPSLLTDFSIQFLKNPTIVNSVFHTWLPRLMFLMMPITMLIGAIFIRGRGNALLFDHLVHASYIHAVTYFLLFISLIGADFVKGTTLLKISFISMLIYLPLSAKRMFSRGWLKTLWTSYGVGFIYGIIMIVGLTILIATRVGAQIETLK